MDAEPAERPAELNEGQPEKQGENPASSDPSAFEGPEDAFAKVGAAYGAGVVKPLNHTSPSDKRKLILPALICSDSRVLVASTDSRPMAACKAGAQFRLVLYGLLMLRAVQRCL